MNKKFWLPAMMLAVAFTGCNNDDDMTPSIKSSALGVNVTVNEMSRAMVHGTELANGQIIGVTVVAADGTDYDGKATGYKNIDYTSSTPESEQIWAASADIMLSGTVGKAIAYYPYAAAATDYTAIPVDMTAADQTDWMFAREADSDAGYGVSNTESSVRLTLNHALVNVCLNFLKGDYVAAGTLQSVSVSSPAFATGGVLDARTGTWTSTLNDGQALTVSTAGLTVGSAVKNVMLVPTGTESAVSITAVIDNRPYTVSSSSLAFKDGHSYNYNLTVNSTGMELTEVTVTPWVPGMDEDENLTLQK